MKKNYHPKSALKQIKRLFYQSLKSNKVDGDSSNESNSIHDKEISDPIIVNHSDHYDLELAQEWMRIITMKDFCIQKVLLFYETALGFKWSTRNDPLEVYQKSVEEMMYDRLKELEDVKNTLKERGFQVTEMDQGYKIETKIFTPKYLSKLEKDDQNLIKIDMYIKFWDNCRYPYENPIFYVLSKDLQTVQLLNISFGLQEAADLQWYGVPMIMKALDWLDGEQCQRRLVDRPSNYVLPTAYNLLEQTKLKPISIDFLNGQSQNIKPIIDQETSVYGDDSVKIYDTFLKGSEKKSVKRLSKDLDDLPVSKVRGKLLHTIINNPVVIISGETGCGKSTQVPKYLLEHYILSKIGAKCNIVCTQPRRISAISLATRVSHEIGQSVGDLVGYAIRLESKANSSTKLLYCTTGVLLRKLQQSESSSSLLLGYSHIIIDEVHERSIEMDFILLLLKHCISLGTQTKVILMSATANTAFLQQYFGGDTPVVHITGRTFSVEVTYLEDVLNLVQYSAKNEYRSRNSRNDLNGIETDELDDDCLSIERLKILYPGKSHSVLHSLQKIDPEKIQYPLIKKVIIYFIGILQGNVSNKNKKRQVEESKNYISSYRCILVFLPGLQEILYLRNLLLSEDIIKNVTVNGKYCIALHSSIATADQRQIFEIAKDEVIKIVLSTNIAETSVTIPDVSLVIDCGRMKETRYDPSKGIVSLDECWVSKANALQRSGRAGRVCSGKCIRLFSSRKYKKFDIEPKPEIKRTPLEQLLLKIKMLSILESFSILEVVSQLIDPPSVNSVRVAIRSLQSMKALTCNESLTPLGNHLGILPVDIKIGKLLLYGCMFDCVGPISTIAAFMTSKSPFLIPMEKIHQADSKKLDFLCGDSDHITLLNMYDQWILVLKKDSKAQKLFLKEYNLSRSALDMISATKQQLLSYLVDIEFLKSQNLEKDTQISEILLIKAVLVAAFYPNIIKSIPDNPDKPKKYQLISSSGDHVRIHPSSVFRKVTKFWPPFILYFEKLKTDHVFIIDATIIDPLSLVLFGGEIFLNGKNILMENGWIRITSSNSQVLLFLKTELERLVSQKLENPNFNLNSIKSFLSIKNLISSGGQKV